MILTLKHVEDNDIQQIGIWLHKEHILKWYHDAEDWLMEIRERNGSFCFLNHFMVLKDNKPIGFCQYYDCFDAQEDWYSIDESNKIFSLDYLIGEEEYLGKGYGKAIVKLLIGKIKEQNPEAEIIVQPENENIASCKALLSNGFVYNEEKEYFKLAR
jgi:Acetyltransferase (GNAT) family.